jgi:hypoxanthine phosphoribosyltransferase
MRLVRDFHVFMTTTTPMNLTHIFALAGGGFVLGRVARKAYDLTRPAEEIEEH